MSDKMDESDAHLDKEGRSKLGENLMKSDSEMRKLLDRSKDMSEASERGEDTNYSETSTIIQRAEDLLGETKYSSTAYLDAQIVNTTAIIYKNAMDSMESHLSEFKPSEFATNLLSYLENKGGKDIWTTLEDEAVQLFNNTGGWSWQLGTLDNECVDELRVGNVRKPKSDKINVVNAPLQNPKKVERLEKEEEDLEKSMEDIMIILVKWERKHKEPLQFWELVLHPTSFSQTVENIFYISHMVKEGLVFLGMDRNKLPIIRTEKKDGSTKGAGVPDAFPVVITINMEQWKDLVEAYEIEESMIPSRRDD